MWHGLELERGNMYHKIRFTSKEHGNTAGLVLTAAQIKQPITKLSRLFPTSEFRKMVTLQVSPAYKTWDEAFAHQF